MNKQESIIDLLKHIKNNCSFNLKEVFNGHVFVGSIDIRRSLFQYKTKLYVADMFRISRIFFYEIVLKQFGCFDKIRFSEPLSTKKLILLALTLFKDSFNENQDDCMNFKAKYASELLDKKATMINKYFAIEIQDGKLHALPLLLYGYPIPFAYIPIFLLRLTKTVECKEEIICFHKIAMEVAKLYQLRSLKYYFKIQEISEERLGYVIKHLLFPAFQENHFHPPKFMTLDGSVTEIACLHKLYKTFERC